MPTRTIFDMRNEDLARVRRWIAEYRDRRLEALELKRRLMDIGYAEREAATYVDLVASTS